jgi:alpha-beta hydrolase superfamily lysophospholipase
MIRFFTFARTLAPFILAIGCAASLPVEPEVGGFDALLALPRADAVEGVYTGSGGAQLGFVAYRKVQSAPGTALVYLHGIESHAGWFDAPARLLSARGYDAFCLDRRGSGINRENRGFQSGYVDSYETLLADIRDFVKPLHEHYASVSLIGLSWGGRLALAYGLTEPGDADGLVLITPGIRSKVDLPTLEKLRVGVASFVAPRSGARIPIEDDEMFTTTPRFLEYLASDPLRLRRVTARFLMEHRRLGGYIDRRMPENALPILLFLAGRDRIVDNDAIVEVLERGASGGELEVVMYEDQTHSIQFDAPQRLVADMSDWLERTRRTPQRARRAVR